MKVHQVSETAFFMKGQGVHTAFMDLVALLKEKDDLEVVVNNEGKGDIFHGHTYGPYYFWKGLKYKGKRIHTVHVIPDSIKGSLPFWKALMPFVKWYLKKVYSFADVLIAISPMVEEAILDLGVKTPIKRIYNPIRIDYWKRTPELREAGRKRLGLSKNDFVVLGVGQIQGRKGVEDFIEVAKNVVGAKFIWAGGRPFGVFTEGIARIDQNRQENAGNIQFTGILELEVMPEIYAAADLFLFPSFQENCPLAPLEAAASGMPVIYRDIREYEYLYENPYLKASSILEFTSMVNQCMFDSDYYHEGIKISETLLHQFDKNYIRAQIVRLYRSLNGEDVSYDTLGRRTELVEINN